jgi:hypothetical protein
MDVKMAFLNGELRKRSIWISLMDLLQKVMRVRFVNG